ncbi:MAG: branched-chain amino acid ABC transporter permease [Haloarculaceae archaeon]
MPSLAVALLNGLTWGLAVALIALGLNLIFGLLEVVNMSHGALYMLGAVATAVLVGATGSFLLALVVAPLAVGALGVATERLVLRPVEDDLSTSLIATFGLMLVFEHAALVWFGPGTRAVPAPIDVTVAIGGVSYSGYRLLVALASLGLVGLLHLFLRSTRHGLWMRGVRQDRETAAAMGVPTSRVYMFTFGLGAGLAALAGVLLVPIVSANHLMGLDVLAVAFIVVIVGGLGSMRGVLVASLVYALVENLATVAVPPVEARVLTLVAMIAFVLVRPEGLFGEVTT